MAMVCRSDFIAAMYALSLAPAYCGIATAARMPSTTQTITTSIGVNPFRFSAMCCSTEWVNELQREVYPPSILIPTHDVIVKTALQCRHDRRVPPIDHPSVRG